MNNREAQPGLGTQPAQTEEGAVSQPPLPTLGRAPPDLGASPTHTLLFGKGRNRFSSDVLFSSIPSLELRRRGPGVSGVRLGLAPSRSPESPRPGADEVQVRGEVLLDDRQPPHPTRPPQAGASAVCEDSWPPATVPGASLSRQHISLQPQ